MNNKIIEVVIITKRYSFDIYKITKTNIYGVNVQFE